MSLYWLVNSLVKLQCVHYHSYYYYYYHQVILLTSQQLKIFFRLKDQAKFDLFTQIYLDFKSEHYLLSESLQYA